MDKYKEIILTVSSVSITALISYLIFKIKFSFDKNSEIGELANAKLKVIVNQLLYHLIIDDNIFIKKNAELMNAIKNEGDFIPIEDYNALISLIKIESKYNRDFYVSSIDDELDKMRYSDIRSKLIGRMLNEKKRLMNISDSMINKFIKYENVSWHEKLVNKWYVLCESVLFVLIIALSISEIYYSYAVKTDNPVLHSFSIITILIAYFGLVSVIQKILIPIYKFRAFKNDRYRSLSSIKKDGIYKCLICGGKIYGYKNSWFPLCCHQPETKSISLRIRHFFYEYYWQWYSEIDIPNI